jgi:hypothetical protein
MRFFIYRRITVLVCELASILLGSSFVFCAAVTLCSVLVFDDQIDFFGFVITFFDKREYFVQMAIWPIFETNAVFFMLFDCFVFELERFVQMIANFVAI